MEVSGFPKNQGGQPVKSEPRRNLRLAGVKGRIRQIWSQDRARQR